MTKNLPKLIVIAAIVCVVSVGAMIFSLVYFAPETPEFIPPSFDALAMQGPLEENDDLISLGWSKVSAEGLLYTARICGRVVIVDQKADIWFYNEPDSSAWLKLRIVDAEGVVISETGLIKPGEYLQSVEFNRALADDEAISMKIMGYEPETYMSAGAATLKTTVKNGK